MEPRKKDTRIHFLVTCQGHSVQCLDSTATKPIAEGRRRTTCYGTATRQTRMLFLCVVDFCIVRACSLQQIRASNTSGECSFNMELRRGHTQWGGQQKECVKRRAELSVKGTPGCSDRVSILSTSHYSVGILVFRGTRCSGIRTFWNVLSSVLAPIVEKLALVRTKLWGLHWATSDAV